MRNIEIKSNVTNLNYQSFMLVTTLLYIYTLFSIYLMVVLVRIYAASLNTYDYLFIT